MQLQSPAPAGAGARFHACVPAVQLPLPGKKPPKQTKAPQISVLKRCLEAVSGGKAPLGHRRPRRFPGWVRSAAASRGEPGRGQPGGCKGQPGGSRGEPGSSRGGAQRGGCRGAGHRAARLRLPPSAPCGSAPRRHLRTPRTSPPAPPRPAPSRTAPRTPPHQPPPPPRSSADLSAPSLRPPARPRPAPARRRGAGGRPGPAWVRAAGGSARPAAGHDRRGRPRRAGLRACGGRGQERAGPGRAARASRRRYGPMAPPGGRGGRLLRDPRGGGGRGSCANFRGKKKPNQPKRCFP